MTQLPIVIAGGGPVGAVQSLALAYYGIPSMLIDPDADSLSKDIRGYALAHTSQVLLENLGLWQGLSRDAEPILDIKITNGKRPWALAFEEKIGDANSPMGYIIEAHKLKNYLKSAATENPLVHWIKGVSVQDFGGACPLDVTLSNGDKVQTPLLIGADGKGSFVRQRAGIDVRSWSYNQTALVTTLQLAAPHKGTAYEKFLKTGPFATLPMTQDRVALVWANPYDRTTALLDMAEDDFCLEVAPIIGSPVIGILEKRQSYPLGVQMAKTYIASRIALIGDAAHVIHPLAGQGMNLGFRDVAALATTLSEAKGLGIDLGAVSVLEGYQRWRQIDNTSMALMTDTLNRLFSNNSVVLEALRGLGLKLTQACPPLKRMATHHAMGLMRNLPPLLRSSS